MGLLGSKPATWNANPGMTRPEWAWAWDKLELCHAVWEGGGAPRDLSGHHHTASLVNTPSWENTQLGPGIDFDGGNDHVDTGFDIDSIGTPFTVVIECLLNTSGTAELWGSSSASKWSVAWFTSSIKLNFQDDTDGDIAFQHDQVTDVPQQFVFMKEAAGIDPVGYANGKLLGTAAGGTNNPNGTTLRYGGRGSSAGWHGPVWGFRVYSKMLKQSQVTQLYNDPWGMLRRRRSFGFVPGGAVTRTKTATADSILKALGVTKTGTADAAIAKLGILETATADAILKALGVSNTGTANAILLAAGLTRTSTADAILKALGVTKTATANAILKALGLTKTGTADAVLISPGSKILTGTADAILEALGVTKTGTADAILSKSGITSSATADAILQSIGISRTAAADALLQALGVTRTGIANAILLKIGIAITATADAILSLQSTVVTKICTASAIIQKIGAAVTGTADAILFDPNAPVLQPSSVRAGRGGTTNRYGGGNFTSKKGRGSF